MKYGDVAQLGERQLCKLDVVGSIPTGSTNAKRDLAELVDESVRDQTRVSLLLNGIHVWFF